MSSVKLGRPARVGNNLTLPRIIRVLFFPFVRGHTRQNIFPDRISRAAATVVAHLLSTKKIKVTREPSIRERATGDGEIPVFSAAANFRAIGDSVRPDKNRKRERKREVASANVAVAIN